MNATPLSSTFYYFKFDLFSAPKQALLFLLSASLFAAWKNFLCQQQNMVDLGRLDWSITPIGDGLLA